MARLGRKWRILKWSGLVPSVLIAGLWAFSVIAPAIGYHSYGFAINCGDQTLFAALRGGGIWVDCFAPPNVPKGLYEDLSQGIIWRFAYVDLGVGRRIVFLPLWLPFLLIAIPTALLWWLDRRRLPPGHCRRCGYDLTRNVSGVCPECSMAVPERRASAIAGEE